MAEKNRRPWLRRLIAYGVIASFVAVAIALALPKMWRRAAPSPRAECMENLHGAYLALSSFYEEHGSYSPVAQLVGFYPERPNRYAYFLDGEGPVIDRGDIDESVVSEATGFTVDVFRWGEHSAVDRSELPHTFAGAANLGLSGTCPDCSMTVVCAGRIHDGRTLDIWSISTHDRYTEDGALISRGQPYRER